MIYQLDIVATAGDFYLLVILTLIPLFALIPFWMVAFRRNPLPIQSLPVVYAQFFMRVTPPVFILAAVIYVVLDSESETKRLNTAIILHVSSSFFIAMANIGIAIGIYFVTAANRYVIQGSTAWWKMVRVEALATVLLLLAIGVTFLTGGIILGVNGMSDWGQTFLNILSLTIDSFQFAATLYSFGTILLVIRALKKENDVLMQGMGKIPLKILSCCILWMLRCTYDIAFTIRAVRSDKVYREPANLVIPTRMIDFSLPPAVFVLLIVIIRDDVWHDEILQPDTAPPRSPKVWLCAIGHGLLDTFRSYLAVFGHKKKEPSIKTPPPQLPEIPLDSWDQYLENPVPTARNSIIV